MTDLTIDRGTLLSFRASATHLLERLPKAAMSRAARPGLQDSAPRAALISLNARVRDIAPDSWEDAALAQLWGPRGADYLICREDVGIFSLGRLPRDELAAREIYGVAKRVHEVLAGRQMETREVSRALPDLGHSIRWSAITGTVLISWDASRIWLVPSDPPGIDPESARRELARRFFAHFGPATREQFVRWAGVQPVDAQATLRAIDDELTEVVFGRQKRYIMRDGPGLGAPLDWDGPRLLPHNDPYLRFDADLVVPDPVRRLEAFPQPRRKPAFWPVSGAVVDQGEVIASWARQSRHVTINAWGALASDLRDRIEAEALALPIAGKKQAAVTWIGQGPNDGEELTAN